MRRPPGDPFRMSVEELIQEVRSRLIAQADPAFREDARKLFREPVDPYGVRSSQLAEVERYIYGVIKCWPSPQRNRFFNLLWKSGKFEEATLVCHVYRRFKRECTACEFGLFERWIDRYVNNWAHCDGVASWLLAACIENQPELAGQLARWTCSPDPWKRRAAAVALLQEAKKGRRTEVIFEVADLLIADSDEMVQKGVGWLLKEAYPPRPREVVEFLSAHRERASRLLLRYAAEKMSAEDKATVLG
ncbi:MAG: DNA alkylation repair protein [Bryobacteraceae bacterium]